MKNEKKKKKKKMARKINKKTYMVTQTNLGTAYSQYSEEKRYSMK
jgi:hypothetical protein